MRASDVKKRQQRLRVMSAEMASKLMIAPGPARFDHQHALICQIDIVVTLLCVKSVPMSIRQLIARPGHVCWIVLYLSTEYPAYFRRDLDITYEHSIAQVITYYHEEFPGIVLSSKDKNSARSPATWKERQDRPVVPSQYRSLS